MIWSKDAECLNRNEMEQVQLERLKRIVNVAYNNVPFYKNRFDEIGLKPDQ